MCAAPIYSFYGSWESVGPFVEGAALQEIYSILAAIWRWEGTRYVLLTHHVHKGYRWRGQWCAFSNSQKATAASQRITEVYHSSNGSYISKLLNPQQADPASQDALGLITLYPRPDEHWSLQRLPADTGRRSPIQPPFPSEPLIRSSQNFPFLTVPIVP